MSAKQADGLVLRVVAVVVVASAVMVALMAWAAVAQPFTPDNDAWTVVHVAPAFVGDPCDGPMTAATPVAPAPIADTRLCAATESMPTVQ